MTNTPIQALATKTAVFAGASVDVSGFLGDWTLKIRVSRLTANKTVRFQFTDSVDGFTNKAVCHTLCVAGEISPAADKVHSIQKYSLPQLRMGVASAVLRLEITAIDSGASVEYCAWLESA